uniref:Secreted protein n=1 Tax=Panagrolaimus superbus TaxID=310955 RepID=A0A914Z0Y5_9BILA
MLSFFKFVLILQLFGVACAVKGNCTINAIGVAQQAFNQKLGISSSISWQYPLSLGVAIQNVYINGVMNSDPSTSNGLVAVCNAYNQFLGSLVKQNVDYNSCLDPRFLIKNDASPIIGYIYAGVMRMVEYSCGAGLFPAISSWDCIQGTYATRNSSLFGCLNALHLDSETNITAACSYTKTAITCWQQQFLQTCGNNNDVSYYACQTIRAYTSAAYGECNDRCLVFGPASYAIDEEIEKLQEMDKNIQKMPSPKQALLAEIKAKYMRT